jgi:hypothetical protein
VSETIQAKPTRYAGCHFRSRLEARWAVFFDTLGLRWEYEPEGFLGCWGACYLPDFFLPEVLFANDYRYAEGIWYPVAVPGIYVEVKPTYEKLHEDGKKIGGCIDYHSSPISRHALLILGPPPDPRRGVPSHSILWWAKGVAHRRGAFCKIDNDLWEFAWLDDSQFGGDDNVGGEDGIPRLCTPVAGVVSRPWFSQRLIAHALTAARSARFEHGQSGAT